VNGSSTECSEEVDEGSAETGKEVNESSLGSREGKLVIDSHRDFCLSFRLLLL
jgi:hypothetical protein